MGNSRILQTLKFNILVGRDNARSWYHTIKNFTPQFLVQCNSNMFRNTYMKGEIHLLHFNTTKLLTEFLGLKINGSVAI